MFVFMAFTENVIDGSTLVDLTNDIDEFKTVLPKSAHRLKVKKIVNQAGNGQTEAKSICSTATMRSEDSTPEETVEESVRLLCY